MKQPVKSKTHLKKRLSPRGQLEKELHKKKKRSNHDSKKHKQIKMNKTKNKTKNKIQILSKPIPNGFSQRTGLSTKVVRKVWKYTEYNRVECYHLLKVILIIKESYPRTTSEFIVSVLLDVLKKDSKKYSPIMNHTNTQKYIEDINKILYGIRHTPNEFKPLQYI